MSSHRAGQSCAEGGFASRAQGNSSALQKRLDEVLVRLDGLRLMTETEMLETLTPHERCRWKKSQAHAAIFDAAQIDTQNDTVSIHAQQVAMSHVIASGCPPDPLVNVSGTIALSVATQLPAHGRKGCPCIEGTA